MKYTVKYSKLAILDLERIKTEVFSASKSPDIAEKYIDDLMDKIEAKALMPKSGTPLYYKELFTGYYFVVFKAYISFYRIEDSCVLVDRILYGKSDYIHHLGLDSYGADMPVL